LQTRRGLRIAIDAYASGPAEQRSYGDEAIAWIDLAIARASDENADLDAAADALRTIEEQPRERQLPTLVGPLTDLRAALSTPATRDARRAIAMRGTISDVIAICQRPLTGIGG
jgi:C4-dicarboxylate-specific signal transduction histidine kinase